MKIGVLIPTRGDRPLFLEFAKDQMSRQTRKPDLIEIVDDPPKDPKVKDITWRYRIGCERLFSKGADVVAFIEDDDWYSPDYLQYMFAAWEKNGRPSIFGLAKTYYYHLAIRSWFEMNHPNRASAMSTMVSKDIMNMKWNKDEDPFTDIHLWKSLRGPAIYPERILAIGIKHGIGLCGGMGHNRSAATYRNKDISMGWLFGIVDDIAAQFYIKMQSRLL